MLLKNKTAAKRGDTIVEAMFALAVFSLVAIISISLMNMGVRQAEGALEGVTARNELNAQAEALRFIHSSYISEMSLPECGGTSYVGDASKKCQQYTGTWKAIVDRAVTAEEAAPTGLLNLGHQAMNGGCEQFYKAGSDGRTPLANVGAFVINTRDVDGERNGEDKSYISSESTNKFHVPVFRPAELNARMIYTYGNETQKNDSSEAISDSTTEEGTNTQVIFDKVLYAEGLWVFAVKSAESYPTYYDFYIETCWYSPNSSTPSTLDTVIRLYNPTGVRK